MSWALPVVAASCRTWLKRPGRLVRDMGAGLQSRLTTRDDNRAGGKAAGDDINITLLPGHLDRLDLYRVVLSNLIDKKPVRAVLHRCGCGSDDVGLCSQQQAAFTNWPGHELTTGAAAELDGMIQRDKFRGDWNHS